ncbi:MAG: low specificity L-threonine aldolase [Ruminococcaceae bacterium]|nr:low specificity L-threonine aldolase [Oscillospiraceae bacterium]
MLFFESDYTEGAHPAVLAHLNETNLVTVKSYGADIYSASAADKIRAACEAPQADVVFLTGGTQTNLTVISAMLRPYEGVIAAETGHINAHEAGAIEYTGHKVLSLPEHEGKLDAAEVAAYCRGFYADETREHMVFPGMVYISHPTEYGTLYSEAELAALSAVCHEFGMSLFMDGARLGYGLMSEQSDLSLPRIAALCDVFYIGGTKVGTLCGEAVVFPRGNKPLHFLTTVKQHGALLAKGRVVGVQFDALFTDGLYFRIGRHAIEMANALKALFLRKGYELFIDSPTNQQFVVLPNEVLARLKKDVAFSVWQPLDEQRTVARFVTSWATDPAAVAQLAELL